MFHCILEPDLTPVLKFLYKGKMVAHTREKSVKEHHRAVVEDKLVIPGINIFLSRSFLLKLFKILLDRKWAPKFVPLLKYSPLNKTDYEILVWVCGAAITALTRPSRRLSKIVCAILSSMKCGGNDPEVTKYSGMVKDHNRGGLKFVKKDACELMGTLEMIFQKQSTTAIVDKKLFVKTCKKECEALFLSSIDQRYRDKQYVHDVNVAFTRFLLYFHRCRAHHNARILSEGDTAKKVKSLRKTLKKNS